MSKVKVGVTGYSGFIGSHLIDRLSRESNIIIIHIEDSSFKIPQELKELIGQCDCIVHLAGMNRGDENEIYSTNVSLVNTLLTGIGDTGKKLHLIFASSILTEIDPSPLDSVHTAFVRAKIESISIMEAWARRSGSTLSVLTIPNVFGDRCKPFYNSVVATFCYQLTHGEQPKIIEDREIELIYINELAEEIYSIIKAPPKGVDKVRIQGTKNIKVSSILSILENFRDCFFTKRIVPSMPEVFCSNLYNVFLSYVDYAQLEYSPKINSDQRGDLFEILKLADGGQVFFSTTKPGIIRGNHYHTRKMERFCVIQGLACIRLRRIGTKEIIEYKLDAKKPMFVEIPIFHTHHIENTGESDLYTLFWCNELFDPADPDTYPEEVIQS